MAKRLYPSQPAVGVGAVILNSAKILLERRGNDPGRGKWSIPGGLIDLGETPEQSVLREVLEETGLTVSNPELIDVVNSVQCDGAGRIQYHFVIIDYFLRFLSGRPQASSDALDLKWVEIEEVEKFDLTRSFREFMVRNKEKLEKRASVG